jgi:hypothetical protein
MNELTKFGSANLPSAQSLAQSLRGLSSSVAASGGAVILKMDKTGHWVFGSDQTEVEDDSLWAINPFSFVHGYIAWGNGEPLGEKMVPVTHPLPEVGEAPKGADKGWETQVGLSLKCTAGEDKDMEARFAATSVGGKRAVQVLALAIATQVEKDQTKPVPVVRLKKEHYAHKKYGKVFTPVFEVVDWISLDGPAAAAPAAEAEPEADEPAPAETGRRRRRAA